MYYLLVNYRDNNKSKFVVDDNVVRHAKLRKFNGHLVKDSFNRVSIDNNFYYVMIASDNEQVVDDMFTIMKVAYQGLKVNLD